MSRGLFYAWKGFQGVVETYRDGQHIHYGFEQTVVEAIGKSNTREEFIHYLNNQDIEANFLSNKVLLQLDDGKKCGSDKLLAYGDFTKEKHEQCHTEIIIDIECVPFSLFPKFRRALFYFKVMVDKCVVLI